MNAGLGVSAHGLSTCSQPATQALYPAPVAAHVARCAPQAGRRFHWVMGYLRPSRSTNGVTTIHGHRDSEPARVSFITRMVVLVLSKVGENAANSSIFAAGGLAPGMPAGS